MSFLLSGVWKWLIPTLTAIAASLIIWMQSKNKKQLEKQIELNNKLKDNLEKDLKLSRETIKKQKVNYDKVSKIENDINKLNVDDVVKRLRDNWSRD